MFVFSGLRGFLIPDLRLAFWPLKRARSVGRDDDLPGRFLPAAAGLDAGVGAHGAEDGVARNSRACHPFHEHVEGGADVFGALGGEAEGVRVAVDGGVVGEFVFLDDAGGADPVEVVPLDFGAARVMADMALTGVAKTVGFAVGVEAPDDGVDVHVRSSSLQKLLPRLLKFAPTHANRSGLWKTIVETTQTQSDAIKMQCGTVLRSRDDAKAALAAGARRGFHYDLYVTAKQGQEMHQPLGRKSGEPTLQQT
jgi:hypothetical protein